MVKAVLKKPLDGKPEGSIVEFNKTDFEMLQGLGAVAPVPEAEPEKEPDLAPTPTPTPTPGKAAAVPEAEPEKEPDPAPTPTSTPAPGKAAAVPENKMAPGSANKSADAAPKTA